MEKGKSDANSGSELLVLTDSTFFNEVSKREMFVVDFWAPWCGPCKEASPIIDELAKKYATRAKFGKVNVDENAMVSDMFGVDNIPSLIIFKNGRPLDNLVGITTRSGIESFLQSYLEVPGNAV